MTDIYKNRKPSKKTVAYVTRFLEVYGANYSKAAENTATECLKTVKENTTKKV